LVVGIDEQVHELVAVDREMPDRAIDYRKSSLNFGVRLEPFAQLLLSAFSARRVKLASEQLRGIRFSEAAVVIVLDCGGVIGSSHSHFDCVHAPILTGTRNGAIHLDAWIEPEGHLTDRWLELVRVNRAHSDLLV
jgi:hypothetical protein